MSIIKLAGKNDKIYKAIMTMKSSKSRDTAHQIQKKHRLWKNPVQWVSYKRNPDEEYYRSEKLSELFGSFRNIFLFSFIVLTLIPIFILAYVAINQNSSYATIFAAIIAVCGGVFNVLIMQVIYKNEIDQQKENIKEMKPYYDKLRKLFKKYQNITLEELSTFLEEFDDNIEQYGSSDIAHKWKEIKEIFITTQQNPSQINNKDLQKITSFICTIRQELGNKRSLSPFTKQQIYQELQAQYQKSIDSSHKNQNIVNNTLKFAGSWNDLADEEFNKFLNEIPQRRQQTFSEQRQDESLFD